MRSVKLTVIGKPDCHLCDVAAETIAEVVAELSGEVEVDLEKLSILEDQSLYEKYWEQIPVILVDGVEHAHWRVGRDDLRTAILEGANC